MSSRLTLILGGARSGKSAYAQALAEETGQPVTFLATAQALDYEMSIRIEKHRSERPSDWETLEIPLGISAHVHQIKTEVLILDCITLLVSNVLMQFVENDYVKEDSFLKALHKEVTGLLDTIREHEHHWIIVSNEVGLGLVPPYQMGRVYRDGLGSANQQLARAADNVILMVAGIPAVIK
jgi:adenosylcobinamide kinase/adenosylcobinamide-phosphate guanylyltransferase